MRQHAYARVAGQAVSAEVRRRNVDALTETPALGRGAERLASPERVTNWVIPS